MSAFDPDEILGFRRASDVLRRMKAAVTSAPAPGPVHLLVAAVIAVCSSACTDESEQRAYATLSTQARSSSPEDLDRDLRTFAAKHDLRLRSASFPGSPTEEIAYQLTGRAYEIIVREPFIEGEYRATFYGAGPATQGSAELPGGIRAFQLEVLPEENWRRR